MNYASYHFGSWRDGQMPALKNLFLVVSHDQTNDVYEVQPDKRDSFLSWVSWNWAKNDVSKEDDESDEDFLARIGVTIRELNWS